MTSSPSELHERPFWLQGPCPAWCDQFHEDKLDSGDRRHVSDDVREVQLSTEDMNVHGQAPHKASDYRPTELAIYLDQHVREIGPRVVLDRLPRDRTKLHLLPPEARRIAQALLDMVTLAEETSE
nr:hypothetical protein [Kibdelosporangium sp. MJ126-NF4]CEL14202.1 hypothetical protein [Kibdelosporangium sp. MJ126-NF4]CTQ88570.1 hypothetical protein [Kibdelosporangium sp. MJ126-NF4]